jgi:hypothetical protein
MVMVMVILADGGCGKRRVNTKKKKNSPWEASVTGEEKLVGEQATEEAR